MLCKADNQPVASRFGDAIWLTDLITPDNIEVLMVNEAVASRITNPAEQVEALWQIVAEMPYVREVKTTLSVAGAGSASQHDTWLFPSETLRFGIGNCATRSFLLASLLKNVRGVSDVYCTMGYVNHHGRHDGHAWVVVNLEGRPILLETTQPRIDDPLIPAENALAYEPVLCFDQKNVYTIDERYDIPAFLNTRFTGQAIPFLKDYLCNKCLALQGV